MDKCKCGSYAINPHLHGRDNTDLDLCDVCYWRKRANSTQQLKAEIATDAVELLSEMIKDDTTVKWWACHHLDKARTIINRWHTQ